ncbi:hypothetical protein ABZ921_03075 [Streptomyces atriruber]|uniref:Uncharacterized protein n=1 Tax=Streptomyces atriruber TaxID=545121 RepID=A0ABV3BF12_9ACTN
MRLRHTLGAALGALALVATIPTSAHAIPTEGQFHYRYGDASHPTLGLYDRPEIETCFNTSELADGHPEIAFGPGNATNGEIYLFPEERCGGTRTDLAPHTELGNDFTFKSFFVVGENGEEDAPDA